MEGCELVFVVRAVMSLSHFTTHQPITGAGGSVA